MPSPRLHWGHSEQRPVEPELRATQRARVVLRFFEAEEWQQCSESGWARIDGPWLLWLSDAGEHWQSWPIQNVLCIDWLMEVPDAR